MAITSVGYDGTVNEAQWANLVPLVGSSHYGVSTATDWKVTAHATMDRGVNIATGSGWGHGVLDSSNSTVTLQGAAVSSGSRWDMVVARRNWSGTGGVTSFVLIQGTAAKALPSRNTTPGTLDDQPIALVQFTAGQTAATSIVDLRCWGRNGGMFVQDSLALGYLAQVGAVVQVGTSTYAYRLNSNGTAAWAQTDLPATTSYAPLQPSGWTALGDIIAEPMSGRTRVTVDLLLTRTAASFSVPTAWITLATFLPAAVRYSNIPNKYFAVGISGGGSNDLAMIYIDHRTGVFGIRAPEPFVFGNGGVISVNFVYYIPGS